MESVLVETPIGVSTKYRYSVTIYVFLSSLVGLLLDSGADPNQKDKIGNTPLHLGITSYFYDNSVPGLIISTQFELPSMY